MSVLSFLRQYPLLFPFTLILGLSLLVRSAAFHDEPTIMSIAITLDLLVSMPVFYYLLIRNTETPRITVVTVFIVGLLAGFFLLPADQQGGLVLLKTYCLPFLELAIIAWVVVQVVRTRKVYKAQPQHDFYRALSIACHAILPKRFAKISSTEIAVVYYALLRWGKHQRREGEYTYHQTSGTFLLVGTFMGLIVVETFTAHLLLIRWNVYMAWIATGLSAYTLFQLFALLRSLPRRPIFVSAKEELLYLRYGFFADAIIPFKQIERVEKTKRTPKDDESLTTLSPLGSFSTPNLIIYLRQPAQLSGIYGSEKSFVRIAIYVDEVDEFVAHLLAFTDQ